MISTSEKEVLTETYEYKYLVKKLCNERIRATEDQIKAMCKYYGTKKAYKKFIDNPFIVVLFGVDFAGIERMAYPILDTLGRQEFPQYFDGRIYALCLAAYNQIQNQGSTYATVSELIRKCWYIEKKANVYRQTSPLILGATINKYFKIDGIKIYSKYNYKLEKSTASSLKKITRIKNIIKEYNIDEIENALGIKYDSTQREAFEILKHPVGILTGGPGTGKTTLLKGLIQANKSANRPLKLCAPTGKAAQQMRMATGEIAETIHKTLNIKPYMKGGYVPESGCIPQNSLVIVDETSMLDIEIMECLTKAVAEAHGQLIFVGDADQLESVGVGSVLRDLILSNKFFTVRLDTIHRNAGAIVTNAHAIKSGNWGLIEYDTSKWNPYDEPPRIKRSRDGSFITSNIDTSQEIAQNAVALHMKYFNPDKPHSVKIYTPVKDKKYDTSTAQINLSLHHQYHSIYKDGEYIPKDPALRIGDNLFSVGEPVVVTRNDYELGIMNGDEGVVSSIVGGVLVVDICGQTVEITGQARQYVELGYAVTIHKAQGSSCELAIILLPSEPKCLITRRLAYVAVTRAEKKVIILHECYSFEMAIMDENTKPRQTGLIERLEE